MLSVRDMFAMDDLRGLLMILQSNTIIITNVCEDSQLSRSWLSQWKVIQELKQQVQLTQFFWDIVINSRVQWATPSVQSLEFMYSDAH